VRAALTLVVFWCVAGSSWLLMGLGCSEDICLACAVSPSLLVCVQNQEEQLQHAATPLAQSAPELELGKEASLVSVKHTSVCLHWESSR